MVMQTWGKTASTHANSFQEQHATAHETTHTFL